MSSNGTGREKCISNLLVGRVESGYTTYVYNLRSLINNNLRVTTTFQACVPLGYQSTNRFDRQFTRVHWIGIR